jgi:UTP-glucose-1-phosphate uridylyltransferase
LGTRGETYEITDRDFSSLIKERSGQINRKELKKKYYDAIDKELTVKNENIKLCINNNERTYTPTFNLKKDIYLPITGELLRKKGKYNLLDELTMPLSKYIFFVNTDSEKEVEMAKEYSKLNSSNIQFIVVNGDMKKLLYFGTKAQKGTKELVDIFNVSCTPSVVVQNGSTLQISEYNLIDNEDEEENEE